MTVLVTGGAGYIGSHMVYALVAAGERVVVLDNLSTGFDWAIAEGAPLVLGETGDQALVSELIRQHAVESIIHFAASIVVPDSVSDPLGYYKNNTVNSRALIECAVKGGVKHFIFSSTAAVYGTPARAPVTEDDTLNPMSPYGSSKLMSEIMLRDAGVAQHDLGHQLGRAVGRHRHERIVLCHRHARGVAVDRGGGGEDEMLHAALDGAFDQRARIHRVVLVIAERIGDRVRHHDRGGEMDDGVYAVLRHELGHQRLIASLADDDRHALRHRPIEAGGEIVEHDHALAGIDQRVDHVASDIAGAAGDQDRHDGEPDCRSPHEMRGGLAPRQHRRATRLL